MTAQRSRAAAVVLAAPHPAAVAAGNAAVARGGNAVDAAVAAAMALTVVYPHMCSVGGDLFAVLRRPDGSRASINASGAHGSGSPTVATPVPLTGPRSVTVPGAVSGWARLLELGGSLPADDLLAPAVGLAEDGVGVSAGLAADIAELLAAGTTGTPLIGLLESCRSEGDLLRQPALAATLRTLADEGLDSLYDGTVGDLLARGLRDLDVPVTREDLRAHRTIVEEPWSLAIAGLEVSTAPPNSQGYLLLALLAASASLGDLPDLDIATLVPLFERAERCRDAELADPGHLVLGKAELLDPHRLLVDAPGVPGRAPRATGDTVAVTAVSSDGTAVSLIQSLFHSFGSQVLEPHTGVILHNRGSMFSADPSSPNHPAPGKRPAHTLTPVVVEHADGRLWALGAMGGRAQPQIHLQLLRHLLGGATPQQAVSAPRLVVHDGAVLAEPGLALKPTETLGEPVPLPARNDEVGHAMVCTVSPDGTLGVGIDPRSDGVATSG